MRPAVRDLIESEGPLVEQRASRRDDHHKPAVCRSTSGKVDENLRQSDAYWRSDDDLLADGMLKPFEQILLVL